MLRTRLRDERGVSLLLSLILMSALSITTAGVITYTSAGGRTASRERSSVSARAVAEAGLNNALAILYQSRTNPTPSLNPTTKTMFGEVSPYTGSYPNKRVFAVLGGTATVWGHLGGDTDNGLWTISSTGSVANPNGSAPVTRTLTQTVDVHGQIPGGVPADWNRMIHEDDDPNNCLVITDVTVPIPVRSGGCIEMEGTAKITGAATTVDAGSTVTFVGDSGSGTGAPPDTTGGWTNSSYVGANDGNRATTSMNHNADSANLDVRDFDFGIPANAVITGIRVRIDRSASGTLVRDAQVSLLRASSPAAGSDNKADTTTDWPTSGDLTATYGSSTDTWHPTTAWTAADINSSGFGVRLRTHNNHNTSSRTANVDWIEVAVWWEVQPQSSIGLAGQNVLEANVVQYCKWGSQSSHNPCSTTDHVWSGSYNGAIPDVVKPEVDLDYWYRNARPGPAHGCDNPGGSFVSGFDNNYSAANPHPDRSLQFSWINPHYSSAEVTPNNSDYTCQVHDTYGGLVGEISWNHTTRVLKIKGTIFIDGDFRFDDDGTVVHYQGRGIIFASGDLEFDEMVCAGGQYPQNCYPDMSNWDPSQNMMTVLSGGWSEFDQGATQSPSTPSGLQGLIYSNDRCLVHQWFHLSGPIICSEIQLPSDAWGWPVYYQWPAINTLTEGQKWGTLAGADEYDLKPGPITG